MEPQGDVLCFVLVIAMCIAFATAGAFLLFTKRTLIAKPPVDEVEEPWYNES